MKGVRFLPFFNMVTQLEITNEKKEIAEQQIRDRRKPVDYNTLEYPIEILVKKYLDGIDEDENELFIPDYQREMTWDEDRQSKFIESVLLGLPIPYIFVADISESEDLARLEIIDGTQRIRTLARFIKNELRLNNLEKLESLNGFTFSDLPLSRQRRFQRTTIRMIQYEPTTRIKFESITVGVALALRENQGFIPKSTSFLDSQEFKYFTKGDGSSSQNKVIRRIEYVRDQLLGN